MTDAAIDDDHRMPTDAEMNSAIFWVVSQIYGRADVTVKIIDHLERTGRVPLLWAIARMLDVDLAEFCGEFAEEVYRRTGIVIAPVGMVPMPTEKDRVH